MSHELNQNQPNNNINLIGFQNLANYSKGKDTTYEDVVKGVSTGHQKPKLNLFLERGDPTGTGIYKVY